MAFSRRSSRSPRSRYTLGLLLLTAVTLLVLDLPGTGPLQPVRNVLGGIFSPLRSAGDAVFSPVRNGWHGMFSYDDVKDENDELRAKNEELKSLQGRYEREVAKRKAAEKAAQIVVADVPTKTAMVVSEGQNFDQSLDIDQGSGAGVKKGMAVITGKANGTGGSLLGKVLEVTGGGRAKVQLLTSPDFKVGISLEGGARGILTGGGRDKAMHVAGVALDAKVEKGDYVYTSGINDTQFPADLVIGRVRKVSKASNDLSQELEVTPLADLGSVFVKVVLKDPPK
ncbi:rod shape-determining protein MreC [Aquihabitans sp. G128]|uniref:rod shape-determining protein MreC n=1 Tax=Aquihabitans sp. G128 TaxID=2849779 RepID=UPI001C20FBFD|nr:rod shape-determining protein MreC [Aquihabitans sp. G128]QXC62725.1 rod shape-determining protein MreC [Aquihabitans sp. G128]